MRRTIVLLATMALTLLVASGVALATAIGSAQAANKVVGPGESIQKAIYAADPGDTIVVRGVHREDVEIRKNGIKLRGEDAVIEAPPKSKADSRCSRGLKHPVGICVPGDFDFDTGKVDRYIKDVSISGFTIRGFKKGLPIYLGAARDATLTKNRVLGSGTIVMDFSVGAKIVSNVVRGANGDGIGIHKGRDVTVEGNDVQGSSENALTVEGGSTDVTVEGN